MYTPRINYNPEFTHRIVSGGFIRDSPFSLVDVGASGGVDAHWNAFGQDLCGFGFDPLVSEVNRLNARGERIKYISALLGFKEYDSFLPLTAWSLPNNQPYQRTSSVRALNIAKCDYHKTYNDPTGDGTISTEKIQLDEYFLKSDPHNVDFIKVDTDGSDYEVLLGAKELIAKSNVLGLAVECQFHGLLHDHSNLFSNIDKLARGLGFSLFDIEVQRYSRACLPARFASPVPSCTPTGQVLWADVLYLRDAAADGYEQVWCTDFGGEKLIKLACIFEIFGMPDCATEILIKYRERLATKIDVGSFLDTLTPTFDGKRLSYRQYDELFETRSDLFYPPAQP